MSDQVVVTDADGIRTIRMNRPEKKNALTQPMYAAMTAALDEAGENDAIRCVVIAGAPGAFSAGSDIGDFQKRAETGLEPVTVDFLHALVGSAKAARRRGQRSCGRHRHHHAVSLRSRRRGGGRYVFHALRQARSHSGSGI